MATSDMRQFRAGIPSVLDALDAYRILAPRGALLLDGNSSHPEARRSIVAFTPRLDVRITGDRMTIQHDGGRTDEETGDPLQMLRQVTDAWRLPTEHSGFTGGFVGVIGYGFTRAIEPTLPPSPSADVPDVCLRLCRDALVIDHAAGTMTLWTTDLPGESDAVERLGAVQAELAEVLEPLPDIPVQDMQWRTSMDQQTFEDAVRAVKEHIRTGDLFQANIATRFETDLNVDPAALFFAMRAHNPSPYLCLMDWGDHILVSGSPEQLFAVQDGIIRARPIAGTRRRGDDGAEDRRFEEELLRDPKEQAEHTMLVDLVRNDIAKVSIPGTVHVPERSSIERYRRVMHLVSRVEGTLRPDSGFTEWLAALFPGGTITGAPKHRACLRIHDAEPVPRGHYTGSAGCLNWDHSDAHWNILIRSMIVKDGKLSIHAGSGIVMGSDPEREWKEAGHKAQALLEAATGQGDGKARGDEGMVTQHGSWKPAEPLGAVDARVLLIDHYDSFVHNLADHCAALGADVQVVRSDADVDAAMTAFGPTHVVFGPGPGWPTDAGHLPRLAKELVGRLPVLGVCLGHQALAEAAGAAIKVHDAAVHGEVHSVRHEGSRLLSDLPSPFPATRYHSLVVDPKSGPDHWMATAWLQDGTVMALEHETENAFGLQFHPESIGTDVGLDILFRFLSTR